MVTCFNIEVSGWTSGDPGWGSLSTKTLVAIRRPRDFVEVGGGFEPPYTVLQTAT